MAYDNNRNQRQSETDYYALIKNDILKQNRNNENEYLDNLKLLIKKYQRDISSSQLRNVFSRVKNVKNLKQLYALRPKLAYVYGRPNSKYGMKKLIDILDKQIKLVQKESEIELFKDFFESIIAYHKYYEGGGQN